MHCEHKKMCNFLLFKKCHKILLFIEVIEWQILIIAENKMQIFLCSCILKAFLEAGMSRKFEVNQFKFLECLSSLWAFCSDTLSETHTAHFQLGILFPFFPEGPPAGLFLLACSPFLCPSHLFLG